MENQANETRAESRDLVRGWLRFAVAALGGLGALFIAFSLIYRLPPYPSIGNDEGSYMKVARNYAEHGVYADFSSDGPRYTGAVVAVGPTVILPVAIAFKIVGVSVPLARSLIVAYALLTLGFAALITATLRTKAAAFVAVMLMIVAPHFIEYARAVMGEVPGLFFMVAGLWIWLRLRRQEIVGLVGAGILFGLSSITKNQYALIILPAIFAGLIADVLWYRKRGWLYFIIPAAIAAGMYAAWTYYVLFLLGAGERNIAADLALLRTSTANAFFVVRPTLNIDNFFRLSDTSLGVLTVPIVLYALAQAIRRDELGQRWSLLVLFLLSGMLMYVFSNGYDRYAFPFQWLSVPVAACLLYDLAKCLSPIQLQLRQLLQNKERGFNLLAASLVPGLVLLLFIIPAYYQIYTELHHGSDGPYLLAQYLDANVPPKALIETWEAELAVVTDFTYHFPPYEALVHRNAVALGTDAASVDIYDFRKSVDPDYVVVGPMAATAPEGFNIYSPERLVNYDEVYSIEQYHVYKKR